jgi:hypothetical protein
MQTIITKAGRELGIKPIPSKRVRMASLCLCFTFLSLSNFNSFYFT